MGVLQNEYEGIVRKEAVQLLLVIYEQNKVPSEQLENVYNAMAYAAVNDLYWEVKVKAIDFWHSVIKRELSMLGVIDGCFPSATFSKEKRKIITLTQKEITMRLTQLLDKISSIGCLGVLIACLSDEEDLTVVKASVHVLKYLHVFYTNYNYWEQSGSAQREPTVSSSTNSAPIDLPTEGPSSNAEQANYDFSRSDEVIQSIVSAQDINLLSDAYVNQMSVGKASESDFGKVREKITISSTDFVSKIQSISLEGIVKARTDWIAQADSFETLLTDMMDALQVTFSNEADCY